MMCNTFRRFQQSQKYVRNLSSVISNLQNEFKEITQSLFLFSPNSYDSAYLKYYFQIATELDKKVSVKFMMITN